MMGTVCSMISFSHRTPNSSTHPLLPCSPPPTTFSSQRRYQAPVSLMGTLFSWSLWLPCPPTAPGRWADRWYLCSGPGTQGRTPSYEAILLGCPRSCLPDITKGVGSHFTLMSSVPGPSGHQLILPFHITLCTTWLSHSHHLFPALQHRHLPLLPTCHGTCGIYRVLSKFKQNPITQTSTGPHCHWQSCLTLLLASTSATQNHLWISYSHVPLPHELHLMCSPVTDFLSLPNHHSKQSPRHFPPQVQWLS